MSTCDVQWTYFALPLGEKLQQYGLYHSSHEWNFISVNWGRAANRCQTKSRSGHWKALRSCNQVFFWKGRQDGWLCQDDCIESSKTEFCRDIHAEAHDLKHLVAAKCRQAWAGNGLTVVAVFFNLSTRQDWVSVLSWAFSKIVVTSSAKVMLNCLAVILCMLMFFA